MFGDIEYALRNNLRDQEYAQEYAAAFLNAYIATQIKVIREQRRMTQAELGKVIGTTQTGISRYEDINYSSWSLRTLQKLAHAFDVRLRVSFEPYGTLPDEVVRFDRARLQTVPRKEDPGLNNPVNTCQTDVADIGEFKALKGTMMPPRNEIDEGQADARNDGFASEIASHVGVGRANPIETEKEAERNALREQIERLQKPVTDEEIMDALSGQPLTPLIRTVWKDGIDLEEPSTLARNFARKLIASRAQSKQEQPK